MPDAAVAAPLPERTADAHCLRTVSLQHGFHSGDIVALRESGGSAKAQKTDDGSGLRGLVYRVQETRIIVAVDGDNADEVLSCARGMKMRGAHTLSAPAVGRGWPAANVQGGQ
jgi:hypothetical protein